MFDVMRQAPSLAHHHDGIHVCHKERIGTILAELDGAVIDLAWMTQSLAVLTNGRGRILSPKNGEHHIVDRQWRAVMKGHAWRILTRQVVSLMRVHEVASAGTTVESGEKSTSASYTRLFRLLVSCSLMVSGSMLWTSPAAAPLQNLVLRCRRFQREQTAMLRRVASEAGSSSFPIVYLSDARQVHESTICAKRLAQIAVDAIA
jgi:hypothetical protein